jgi:hypothetical protein
MDMIGGKGNYFINFPYKNPNNIQFYLEGLCAFFFSLPL